MCIRDRVYAVAADQSLLQRLHAAGVFSSGSGHILGLALLHQHDGALDQGDSAGADHDAVRHVGNHGRGGKSFRKQSGEQGSAVSEQRQRKAVVLDEADDDGAYAQGQHGEEIKMCIRDRYVIT